jgi:hypothetical protein
MQEWTISITEQKMSLFFTPAAKEADKYEGRKGCNTCWHLIVPVCTQEVASPYTQE